MYSYIYILLVLYKCIFSLFFFKTVDTHSYQYINSFTPHIHTINMVKLVYLYSNKLHLSDVYLDSFIYKKSRKIIRLLRRCLQIFGMRKDNN